MVTIIEFYAFLIIITNRLKYGDRESECERQLENYSLV